MTLDDESLGLAWTSESKLPPAIRLAATLAARRRTPRGSTTLPHAPRFRPLVRRAAVQWVAEERLTHFRNEVAAILNDESLSADLFLATLASLKMLDGTAPADFDKTPPGKYVLPIVQDKQRPAAIRALALRMVPPKEPGLTAALLGELLASDDQSLRRETVRTLQASPLPVAPQLLQSIVDDQLQDADLRLDAVIGLSSIASSQTTGAAVRQELVKLASPRQADEFRREAIRSLRGQIDQPGVREAVERVAASLAKLRPEDPTTREMADQLAMLLGEPAASQFDTVQKLRSSRPGTTDDWRKITGLPDAGIPDSGRRLFHQATGPGCAKCHTVNGRGGRIGPDLSTIGRSLSREKLIDSILEPSKEIAPSPWVGPSK